MYHTTPDECPEFPQAISSENVGKVKFTRYRLLMTQAQCNFYGIQREIFDGEFPALRAIVKGDFQIEFFVKYKCRGLDYYGSLGDWPHMTISDAKEIAVGVFNNCDDSRRNNWEGENDSDSIEEDMMSYFENGIPFGNNS